MLVRVVLKVPPEEAFRFHREYAVPRKWVEKIILQKRMEEEKNKKQKTRELINLFSWHNNLFLT